MALKSRMGLDETHIGLHSNDHASKWKLNLGFWMKFKLDDWGSLTKNLVHPIIFFGLRKLMIFIFKKLGLYYGFRFLGFSGFLGFLFFVWICCHSQFGAKASAAAITTNVSFLLELSFVFLSCSAFVFSKLFVFAAFYLSIFLLD